MKLSEIKNEMLGWEDFYGQDMVDIDAIESAKSKDELTSVLREHARFLEDQSTDAQGHLERFQRSLGL